LISRNLWYYRQLPELVESVKPDIVHLTYPVPLPGHRIDRPLVLTLHDLYPYELPSNFGFPRVLFNRAILQHCLQGVNAIACVSDTTAERLKKYAPQAVWEKALRIYNCVEAPPPSAERVAPPASLDHHPFLLTVSQHRRNKNIPLLIRALHQLRKEERVSADMKLIIVGISGPETAGIHRLVAELQLSDRVLFYEGLSEPELEWCYRRCHALVAPSQIEGFGLPVAEALLRGCHVVCSDIPAFREIAGEQCYFFDLGANAEANLADAIASTLERHRRLPLLFPQFSLDVVGAQYVELYRNLLSLSAPSQTQLIDGERNRPPSRTAVASVMRERCERDHL
jgi:glycosyltransferase involved in cell wall biosynthesis